MKIINAGKQHIPLIQEIVAVTWPAAYSDILSGSQIEYMIDLFYSPAALTEQMKAGHHFLLCLDNEAAIGFASFELNYNDTPDTKLHKLYVLPGIQGKGAGRKLLDEVVAAAGEGHQEKVILNVNRYNRAIGFYEKYGFIIEGEEDIDIGNGYFMNDYIMALAL